MRWLGRLILAIALVSVLLTWVHPLIRDLLQQFRLSAQFKAQVHPSSFFPLSRNQWLTFDTPTQAIMFRFYFHAALTTPVDSAADPVSYQLHYQWLDHKGTVVKEKYHYISGRHSPLLPPPPAGASVENSLLSRATRFYSHPNTHPSREQALYFSRNDQPDAMQIRFRLNRADAAIAQVGVRAHQQYARDAKALKVAWQRMSEARRTALSDASIYPSFLLSEFERRNLLAKYWKPIGPTGNLNEDYRIETLYIRETVPTPPAAEKLIPDGRFASPEHWVTWVLEAPVGDYRMTWQPLEKGAPEILQLRWQGMDYRQQKEWRHLLARQEWDGTLQPGLLQVIPDRPAMVKLYRRTQEQWQEVNPEKLTTRAFYCTPAAPLSYRLVSGLHPQPLKITARGFHRADLPTAGGPTGITVSTLDQAGNRLTRWQQILPSEPAPYQHFADAALVDSRVFAPLSSYLHASHQTHRLEIRCSHPSLISLLSRPWQHPIKRRLPEEANPWYAYATREPAWFTLQPDNAQHLISRKGYASLHWHLQPVERNPDIAAGHYRWKSVPLKQPGPLEKQVFSPHDSGSPARREARHATFQPILKPTRVRLAGPGNQRVLQPRVIFNKPTALPETVQVWIDGSRLLETTLAGKNGTLRLPPLNAGTRQLEFRPRHIRWYLSNTTAAHPGYILRSAYQLQPGAGSPFPQTLAWRLQIGHEPQQFRIWLYVPAQQRTVNCQLKLQARRPPQAQPSYSFRTYRYQLNPAAYPLSQVLYQRNARVRGPIPLTVQLHDDLPAQMASARLHCEGPGVLASAGLIAAGVTPVTHFEEYHAAE
jgi:hypothetical protein